MLEAEDNMIAGNSRFNQLLRDPRLGPVALYPDGIADQVDVNQNAVNATISIPSDFPKVIVTPLFIKNKFCLQRRGAGVMTCHLLQELAYQGAISGVSIHSVIS